MKIFEKETHVIIDLLDEDYEKNDAKIDVQMKKVEGGKLWMNVGHTMVLLMDEYNAWNNIINVLK